MTSSEARQCDACCAGSNQSRLRCISTFAVFDERRLHVLDHSPHVGDRCYYQHPDQPNTVCVDFKHLRRRVSSVRPVRRRVPDPARSPEPPLAAAAAESSAVRRRRRRWSPSPPPPPPPSPSPPSCPGDTLSALLGEGGGQPIVHRSVHRKRQPAVHWRRRSRRFGRLHSRHWQHALGQQPVHVVQPVRHYRQHLPGAAHRPPVQLQPRRPHRAL